MMKKLCQYSSLLIAGMFLFSCSKNVDETQNLPDNNTGSYQLQGITYSLLPGDGIDTSQVTLNGKEFSNYGSASLEQKLQVNYNELIKKSSFIVSDPQVIPQGLLLDSVKVSVPSNWYSNQSYSVDARLFPLSDNPMELPYQTGENQQLNVTVPAQSRVVINAQIDKYTLRCSFQAIFKHSQTGARDTVSGKWNGTLRYNNAAIKATQLPL